MIYIAKDHNDITIGVVLAENEKLANAYWQGQQIIPNHIQTLDIENLNNHPAGVIPIVKIVKKYLSEFGENFDNYYVVEE